MDLLIKTIEEPFFKIKDKYGWHLTIKAFLELNKNFKRHERSPLKKVDRNKMLKIKKAFDQVIIKLHKSKLEKYF